MKSCPVCGNRYEDDILFCPADGAGLVRASVPKPGDGDEGAHPEAIAETVASAPIGVPSGIQEADAETVPPGENPPDAGDADAGPPSDEAADASAPAAGVDAASDDELAGPTRGAPSLPGGKSDPLIGSRIFGEYVITNKLGEGGMGAVYRAQNPDIEQTIAVKVLHGHAAKNEELVKRFNREAKVICRLTHPNIIRVFIFGRTPSDMIFLAMEHVEGVTLRSIIEEEHHLDVLRAIGIMRQCLHALEEAHELGIIHRDLKPDNIMLTNFRNVSEFVKVLDFGIAKIQDQPGDNNQKLTQAGVVYGTPEYLSPEQAQAKELDGRSDVYSMGVILYEMITGYVPFHANTAVAILSAHVYDEPQPPTKVADHELPPQLDAIIKKALAKKPADRYASAMEFLSDLEDLENELTRGAATKTTVLDASQLSLVLEVSRAAQLRREQMILAAASGVRVPGSDGVVEVTAGAAPSEAAPEHDASQSAPVPAQPPPAASTQNQVLILWTVIAGLVVLLIMVFAALLYVNKQRRSAELSEPPAIERLVERAEPSDLLRPYPRAHRAASSSRT